MLLNELNVGHDSVVMGNVSGTVGDSSVVVGATDMYGNVNLNIPMAVGRNAKAGPGSIAVGSGANAGSTDSNSEVFMLLAGLQDILQSNKDVSNAINKLADELSLAQRDSKKIKGLWGIIESAATVEGAIGLASRIAPTIIQLISS